MEEQELIHNLKTDKHKQAAFRQLVSQYKERLYWHIRRIVLCHEDADDILQNTFMKVWKSIGNFREEAGLYTWMYRIATNESLSFLEQKKRKQLGGADEMADYLVQTLYADSYFDGDEAQLKLQEAIAQLPEKQRLVFNMRYYEDLKYQDMAKILDTSEGALKASYHHAVNKVTEYLKDCDLLTAD